MKTIKLTRGKFAQVDDDKYEELSKYKWYAFDKNKTGIFYADTSIKGKNVSMHRMVIDVPKGKIVDHIDRDGLNNQRANLRVCSHSENQRNRGKNSRNTSGYKGVYWNCGAEKWEASIVLNYTKKTIGYFKDRLEAAKAYNEAAKELHGEFAFQNQFPHQSK